jgi:cysteinyl-tRNA synthetase
MVVQHIDSKIEYTEATIEQMRRELQALKQQREEASNKTGMERWLNNSFESSSGLTPEFATFAKDFKKAITDSIKDNFELVNWSRGHFEVFGFLKNKTTEKMVYFSISDVRYWQNEWYDHILIRTAEHDKDYTGGSNCYTTFKGLREATERLTQL